MRSEDEVFFEGQLLTQRESDKIKLRLETAKQLLLTHQDASVLAKWYVEDVLSLVKQAKYFACRLDECVSLQKKNSEK